MDIHTLGLIGFTLDVIGKLLIAYTAIRIHYRVWKEHRIDDKVFKEMKNEQVIGIVGFALIIFGYILQLPTKV